MKTVIKKTNLLVVVIFIFAFILRFWKVPELFFFGIDEEYQSLLALSIIKDFHLIWIGLSAGNTGFYLGPGLIYIHALLLWVSKLDPIILGYTASTFAMLSIITLYFITKNIFDQKTALIATILYSFFPFSLQYDRRFWNPTLAPLISILFLLCFIKSFRDGRWHLGGAFLMGISFHIHASLLIFLPIYFALLIYQYIKIRHINLLLAVASILIFLTIYSPLIVYDLVHNFDNLKTPFRLLQQNGSKIRFNDYYILGFIPLISIFFGIILERLKYKLLTMILLLYSLWGISSVLRWSSENGLTMKKQLIKKTSDLIGNNSYYLTTNQNYLYFGGWRYLFEAYGKKPSSSQADEMFGWIYPSEISSEKPKLKVIINQKNHQLNSMLLIND